MALHGPSTSRSSFTSSTTAYLQSSSCSVASFIDTLPTNTGVSIVASRTLDFADERRQLVLLIDSQTGPKNLSLFFCDFILAYNAELKPYSSHVK